MTLIKIQKNNRRGFALLFSVLISSLLLTIGLSIFSIALKELAISTAARQSIHAFFAADSGREYVLYQDIKEGSYVTINENGTATFNIPSDPITGFVTGDSGPNYIVTIRKESAEGDISTTIYAQGYDSSNDDKVERAIEQTY
jgi:Tfp pilus assembly protein PilX